MLEQFKEIELKFNDIERRMSDPEIIADQEKYQKIIKEHSSLKEGVELYRDLTKVISEINGANDLLTDPDMKEMAKEELAELTPKKEALELKLQLFLIPKDPDDEKGAIIEIRSGTGGEEAALFAGTLYRMYTKYAESNRWKVSLISQNITGLGGVKEVVFSVEGDQVFGRLKFESGTHRVQRVPDTETSGRIHTSAATVAILAEADEVDVDIDIKDCRNSIDDKDWEFVQQDSTDIEKLLINKPEIKNGIDILYVDSLHTAEHVKKEIYNLFEYLNNDAYIFFDDIDSSPYMSKQRKGSIPLAFLVQILL